jgi:xanthine dehydrogenase small subunit
MMRLIVNDQLIDTKRSLDTPLLTFLRGDLRLHGSKTGCQEGDCGACTVLIGSVNEHSILEYKSIVSCLMPLGSCSGKHVLTIEGIAQDNLNNIQSAIIEEGASQCGFCTPGIIMSLLGFMLNHSPIQTGDAEKSLDGNICRCTGYKSIQRAVCKFTSKEGDKFPLPIPELVSAGYLPGYILDIKSRLVEIQKEDLQSNNHGDLLIGGGTDLMLQRLEDLKDAKLKFLSHKGSSIQITENKCQISGSTTIADLQLDKELREQFPEFQKALNLFASTPIRNMATIAGNIVNASPIGDLSIMLLALDARITMVGKGSIRQIPLDQFFYSYKKTALQKGEVITSIAFDFPPKNARFNFEKISKRRILDIASVNTAGVFFLNGENISKCRISVGGVAPIPLYLEKTSEALAGPKPDQKRIYEIIEIMNQEISPISDIRGSEKYKRMILRQLLLCHLKPLIGETNTFTTLKGL